MKEIAAFEKVSCNQFRTAAEKVERWAELDIERIFSTIRLPKRATSGSAGYDILSPFSFELAPGEEVLIPTGLRCRIEEGWVLMIFPRSGLGSRFRFQLNNTVGIIDSDYYGAENEGHILVHMINDSRERKVLSVEKGDAIVQGVFLPFGVARGEQTSASRIGGFGSTDSKKRK